MSSVGCDGLGSFPLSWSSRAHWRFGSIQWGRGGLPVQNRGLCQEQIFPFACCGSGTRQRGTLDKYTNTNQRLDLTHHLTSSQPAIVKKLLSQCSQYRTLIRLHILRRLSGHLFPSTFSPGLKKVRNQRRVFTLRRDENQGLGLRKLSR
jgi:hypothetical protein